MAITATNLLGSSRSTRTLISQRPHSNGSTQIGWKRTDLCSETTLTTPNGGPRAGWVLKAAVPHIIIEDRLRGPFPLCHIDFHYGNLLFDDDYNLTGVIDWTGAQTVPLERLVVSPEFTTFPGVAAERNKKLRDFRSLVHEHLKTLEEERYSPATKGLPSHIFGSTRQDISYRSTYCSAPQRVFWMGKLVAGLIYGDEVTWEQLVRVYGHLEMT